MIEKSRFYLIVGVLALLIFASSAATTLIAVAQDIACENQPVLIFSYLRPLRGYRYYCDGLVQPQQLAGSGAHISPDGLWTVDYAYSPTRIVVRRFGQAEPIISLPLESHWLASGLRWVDHKHIAFWILDENGDFRDQQLILNPWTNERSSIPIHLPAPPDPRYGFISYNPMQTRVFFANEDMATGQIFWKLLDVQSRRILWSTPYIGPTLSSNHYPIWSSDGLQFIYIRPLDDYPMGFEFFHVDEAGQETQLTNLSVSGTYMTIILYPSWSLDGRYVTFWLNSFSHAPAFLKPFAGLRLSILDMETGIVHQFDLYHREGGSFDTVWSPDSNTFAVLTGMQPNFERLTIVDVHTGEFEHIASRVSGIYSWCYCQP